MVSLRVLFLCRNTGLVLSIGVYNRNHPVWKSKKYISTIQPLICVHQWHNIKVYVQTIIDFLVSCIFIYSKIYGPDMGLCIRKEIILPFHDNLIQGSMWTKFVSLCILCPEFISVTNFYFGNFGNKYINMIFHISYYIVYWPISNE